MRTRLTLPTLVLLGLAALSIGCSSDSGTGPSGPVGDPITYPFTVGNSWIYQTTSTGPRLGGATVDSTTIVRTELVEGQTYYVHEAREEGSSSETWLRQAGQEIYMIEPAPSRITGRGDPLDEWLERVLMESFPWKVADLQTASGTQWALAQAETTVVIPGEGTLTFQVLITGASHGRTSVSVPDGDYPDAYHGQVELRLSAAGVAGTNTIELWIVDGVGLVKQVQTDVTPVSPTQHTTETKTWEMTSYQLE